MPLLLVSLLCAPRGPARGGRRAFARDRPASRRGWAEAGGAPRALRGILRQQISKSTTIRLIYNRKYALISLDKCMSMCTVSASEHLYMYNHAPLPRPPCPALPAMPMS